jgi:hypothetical protein
MRTALVVVVLLALSAAPAQAGWYKPTHRVTVSGQFVNHWTIDDPDDCGAIGGGTVTVDAKSRTPNRAMVGISRSHGSETNDGKGSWTLRVLNGPYVTDMRAKPGRGTVTRIDETQPRAREVEDIDHDGLPDSEPCPPPDRTGCGVSRLKRAEVYAGGYDSKRIEVNLPGPQGSGLPCYSGSLDSFGSPPALAGGTPEGKLLLKMPRPSKLRRRRVVKVTGSSHKVTRSGDPGSKIVTDDVTRTVTVTFTRL